MIDLQTFILTGNTDLVRTDIIKTYLCDVGMTGGSINVTVNKKEAWNEILAYTAILQSKLFVNHETGIINKMVPVWIYPVTEGLAKESMLRGFNTSWRT